MGNALARVQSGADGIAAGIRALRETDRHHVVWLNHAPRNSLNDLRLYSAEADMAGCDIYPAPPNFAVGHSDLADTSLAAVGAYTDRMRAAAPGKACAMVLQGFGWQDLKKHVDEHERALGVGRRPSWAESRFMAYDAILHGANALVYWGTAYLKPVEKDGSPGKGPPEIWKDLLRLARELRALEPALVAAPLKAPKVRLEESCSSVENGILCKAWRVGEDYVVIVINETDTGLAFTLQPLPVLVEGHKLYRLYSPEEHAIAGRRLRDGIKGYSVHVYATSRRFEDPLVGDNRSRP